MIYRAKHRYCDVAPRKMRPLGHLIRGKNVDGAPMVKRIRPRARGTAFGIQKKLSHIVVAVTDLEAVEAAAAAAETAAAQ